MKNFNQRVFTTLANKIKFVSFLVICFVFLTLAVSAQTTIVNYNFNDAVAGSPCNPGTVTNASGSTSIFSTSAASCTTPAGVATTGTAYAANTPGTAVSISNFANGGTQYFQFQLNGVSSFKDYLLYVQLRGSNTGATSVAVQYSLDGTMFTTFSNIMTTTSFAAYPVDLSAVDSIEGKPTIYIRLLGSNTAGTTGTTGTFAIDNFQIAATPTGSTAAGVNVSGNVVSQAGKGIWRASVILSGGSLKSPIHATTDFDGNFNFADVPAGETYIISVSVKGFKFDQTDIVVNLSEDFNQAHFVGTPKTRVGGLK